MSTTINDLREELERIARQLGEWYYVPKIRWYGVQVYAKDDHTVNLFDIFDDRVVYYDDFHVVPYEAMPYIVSIQEQMKKIENWYDEVVDDLV